MSDSQMSFLPEDYVERRIEHRTNLICLSLFVLVLGGVVAAWFVTTRHEADIRRQREQVNASYTEAARRLEQLQQLEERRTQMMRKAQTTASLVEPVPRTFLLADLINRMPSTLSLLEWSITSKQQAAPVVLTKKSALAIKNDAKKKDKDDKADEPPPPRYTVSVSMVGVAPTDVQVAQYMASLSRSPLLDDVNLVFSEETKVDENLMRRFRIEMVVKEGADVRKIDPLTVPRKLKTNPLEDDPIVASPGIPATDGGSSFPGVDLIKSALGGSKEK